MGADQSTETNVMTAAPTLLDILQARKVINRYLNPTPLHHYPRLSEFLRVEIHVKHENHQPIGSFKVRGGINLISQLTPEERTAGVIAASTGNHGQSVAYAAGLFGVCAVIGVPEGANADKVASMEALGARVEFHGKDFDEAREWVETAAAAHGYRYIHSGQRTVTDFRCRNNGAGDPRSRPGYRRHHGAGRGRQWCLWRRYRCEEHQARCPGP